MLPNLEGDFKSPFLFLLYNNVTNKGYLTHTQEKIMSNNTKSGFEISRFKTTQGILEGNIQREENSVYSHNEVHPENKKL